MHYRLQAAGGRGARRSDAKRSLEGGDTSPCVQPAGRFVSAVVTPNASGSSSSSAAAAAAADGGVKPWPSSACMSDEESPVDPRKVSGGFGRTWYVIRDLV